MLFNEISVNYSSDQYIEADNNLASSEEVDVSAVDWRETLRQDCLEEVTNAETINSDLEDKDDTHETSSSNVITAKEALYLFERVYLFATISEEDRSL